MTTESIWNKSVYMHEFLIPKLCEVGGEKNSKIYLYLKKFLRFLLDLTKKLHTDAAESYN